MKKGTEITADTVRKCLLKCIACDCAECAFRGRNVRTGKLCQDFLMKAAADIIGTSLEEKEEEDA